MCARVHLCLPEKHKDNSPQNGKCGPSAPLAAPQFAVSRVAHGSEQVCACLEHGSKPLGISRGVINLIISKAPLIFHEGHAPDCGLEYNCSRFQ